MKLDFEQLGRLKESFHELYCQDGDICEQLDKGSMVFSIDFDPQCGACRVHMQWPYFRNLVANEADCPATYRVCTTVVDDASWIHWTCRVLGVEITACMSKQDVLRELEMLGVAEAEDSSADIESLLALWQATSGKRMEVSQ